MDEKFGQFLKMLRVSTHIFFATSLVCFYFIGGCKRAQPGTVRAASRVGVDAAQRQACQLTTAFVDHLRPITDDVAREIPDRYYPYLIDSFAVLRMPDRTSKRVILIHNLAQGIQSMIQPNDVIEWQSGTFVPATDSFVVRNWAWNGEVQLRSMDASAIELGLFVAFGSLRPAIIFADRNAGRGCSVSARSLETSLEACSPTLRCVMRCGFLTCWVRNHQENIDVAHRVMECIDRTEGVHGISTSLGFVGFGRVSRCGSFEVAYTSTQSSELNGAIENCLRRSCPEQLDEQPFGSPVTPWYRDHIPGFSSNWGCGTSTIASETLEVRSIILRHSGNHLALLRGTDGHRMCLSAVISGQEGLGLSWNTQNLSGRMRAVVDELGIVLTQGTGTTRVGFHGATITH